MGRALGGVAIRELVDEDTWLVPVRPAGAPGGMLVLMAPRTTVSTDGGHPSPVIDHAVSVLAQARPYLEPSAVDMTEYEALLEIGTQIQSEEFNSEAVMRLIVDRARRLCHAEVAWLTLTDAQGRSARVAVASGARTDLVGTGRVRGIGVTGIALQVGRTIVVPDCEQYPGIHPAHQEIMRREGVVSVLCAPMRASCRIVGGLSVANRQRSEFASAAQRLLPLLASQAAIAIENGRLYRALDRKKALLERSAAIHRLLTDVSLSGGGVQEILGKLEEVMGREVFMQPCTGESPPEGTALVISGDHAPAVAGGYPVPITAGGACLGILYTADGDEITGLERQALEHGATVLALELIKEQTALEVEWRIQGEILEEIFRCSGDVSPSLVARAERSGIDLTALRRIVVIELSDPSGVDRMLVTLRCTPFSSQAASVLVARHGAQLVLAVPELGAGTVEPWVRTLQQKAQRAGVASRSGLSDATTDLSAALRQAEAALRLARRGDSEGALINSEALGPLRFLLDAPNTVEMRALVRRTLGPLMEAEQRRNGAPLLGTLRAYLDAGGHQATVAGNCHIHVSTLKYRLARINEILDGSLQDPEVQFRLRLAFAVLDVLGHLGDPAPGATEVADPDEARAAVAVA